MKIIQFDGAYKESSEIHEQIIIELWCFFLRLKIGESFISFKVNCLPVKLFSSPFSLFHFPSHHLPAWPLSRAKSSGIIDWHPGNTNSLLPPSNPWPSLSPILFRGTSPLPPPPPHLGAGNWKSKTVFVAANVKQQTLMSSLEYLPAASNSMCINIYHLEQQPPLP